MILLDVSVAALAGREEGLADLLRRTMVASASEAGCLRYRFTRDLDDTTLFHLVELWENEDALMAHARGGPFRRFLAELPALGRVTRSDAHSGPLGPYNFLRPVI